MGESSGSTRRPVVRRERGGEETGEDQVAVEEPLELRIGEAPLAVTMRTPGHDEELAAGFCLTEGIVSASDDIAAIRPCDLAEYGNVVEIELSKVAAVEHARQVERARREFYVSSSCGLCGKQSIDRLEQSVDPLPPGAVVASATLARLPAAMQGAQDVFAQTGGLHAAAIFGCDGALRVLREDVGRHNAVDKVVGHEVLLGRTPVSDGVLLVSGRASFEIVQKAAMAGIPVVSAISAPSSLAIDLASRLGLTLVGFLRGERMNVYCGAERVG